MSDSKTHELVYRRFYEPESRAISADESTLINEAITGLRTILAFEDKFFVVMENFLELELCTAGIAATRMLRPLVKDEEFGDDIREANRRMINLLTSFRLYRDQTVQHLASLVPGTDLRTLFKGEETKSFAFRVVEALRNHVQHRDLPVYTMTVGSGWASEPPAPKLRHHTRLAMRLSQLEEDDRFPSAVLSELQALPELPDLALLLREYASIIARIHRDLRAEFSQRQSEWISALEEAAAGWGKSSRHDDVDLGLVVAEVREGKSFILFEIYQKLSARVLDLQRRNYCMTALDRAFFTSEIV
jgi:hypothetical protein